MEKRFIKPHRHKFWRYNQTGYYFITITTKDKVHYFGKVEQAKMIYSPIGYKAREAVTELPPKFRNITVDYYQVMPNHVHLLIRIKRERKDELKPGKTHTELHMKDLMSSKINRRGLHPLEQGSISSIVNHYKGRVRLWCKNHNYLMFQWQANYFDKIIRSEVQYQKAAEYIRDNPLNWEMKRT